MDTMSDMPPNTTPPTAGALQGIRVLDMSRVLAGPMAAQMLGDCGADVIKVERPGAGDDARRLGGTPATGKNGEELGLGPMFVCANRNKRSIAIDITQPEGQQLVTRLAAWADVLIENYKTGDLARYGLDYASLSKTNPRLVYCSITGFGQTGPYAGKAGYDAVFQAMSGLMSVTGHADDKPGGGPMRIGIPLADSIGGLYAYGAILTALHHRDHGSGKGQHIDLGLLDTTISMMSIGAANYLMSGTKFERSGTAVATAVPTQLFKCADGALQISAPTDEVFGRLCVALGNAGIAQDPRFNNRTVRVKNRIELIGMLEGMISPRRREDLIADLDRHSVPCAPLYTLEEVFNDPQVRHRGNPAEVERPSVGTLKFCANPIHFSDTPVTIERPPPLLGEHTDNVLSDVLGMQSAEIAALRTKGVL